jgi:hypothetical protein
MCVQPLSRGNDLWLLIESYSRHFSAPPKYLKTRLRSGIGSDHPRSTVTVIRSASRMRERNHPLNRPHRELAITHGAVNADEIL